jgi:hypothetical protein
MRVPPVGRDLDSGQAKGGLPDRADVLNALKGMKFQLAAYPPPVTQIAAARDAVSFGRRAQGRTG